ncbi:hypothetical protein [Stutzerimonas azotifigens]|uniref:Lipoprotein n=1 Tax=Stutzerimonas azotifigens TaxID=291995 RepID=A0ABR5Z0S9_9GAMM|nr:hypothetical protein [Stutzerimonas azotifigens]MBA1273760.1 hypothetical protein [Stutzerimonas azotifigens]
MSLYRTLLLPLLVAALAGCTSHRVYNAEERFPENLNLTQQQMQRAIVTALTDRQWKVQSVEPALIKAAITVRGRHHAEVDIPYSATAFQIQLRSSWGLNEKSGKIHRNYNRWVNRLRDNILRELDIDPITESVDNLGIIEQTSGNGDAVLMDFQQGLQRGLDSGLLDGSVRFFLAGQPIDGEVRTLRSVTSNRKTNASNKSDEEACSWVLQSVLASLQNTAKQAGANAVVNIVSYYKRNAYQDPARYECHAGMAIAGVALRGQLATIE